MDFFDSHYYKGMKILLCLIGRWPYQTLKERVLITIILSILWSYTMFHRMLVYSNYDNYSSKHEVILETISPLIVDTITFAKYITTICKMDTIINLLESIKQDWKIYTNKEEKKILEYYANLGKILSLGYVGAVYMVTVLFMTEPIVEQTFFKLFQNETIPKRFSIPIYWKTPDIEKYYYYLISFQTLNTNFIISITCASDAMFINLLQHVTGLFSVTGYLLENVPIEENSEENGQKKIKDVAYEHYVRCMRSHKRALEFAENLESIYVWCFGIVITLNMPVMSVTAMQLTTGTSNVIQSMKYGTFAGVQLLHLFFYCFMSQKLLTSSSVIPECAMNGKWYLCSVKAQRLVTLVIMRSQISCQLTAGKILVLSMETFTSIVKTSGSYFTMLVQMRNV
uniref:Odorant receptor n=1 Tax=Microplitis mediator TaxID=375433 RepID=M1REW8_9HYME|nr:olfactory receptor 4 [Microplitis mediator]